MKKHVLIILLAVLTVSCSSDDNNARTASMESTLIAKGNLFGNGDEGIVQQNMVINNQSAWHELMTQMDSVNNITEGFSETDIDFDLYTIIAVFDEIQENGGHNLDLSISSNSVNIMVSVTDLVPEGDDTVVVTQPFHIVKITKSSLSIVFE